MSQLKLAARTVWNWDAARAIRQLIADEKPDVLHVHNTLPILSPAVYYAARAEGVPVVQTLHNYRLMCPNALFFREGKVCEACLGKSFAWPGVRYGCYRGSRAASAAVASMVAFHWAFRTWSKAVDRYISLTEFARHKFVQGGLPADRIAVKPNFVHPDPGVGDATGGYVLYVGRLSEEKGISTLLSAWRTIGSRLTLRVVGDGPLADQLKGSIVQTAGIEWLGRQTRDEVLRLMQNAAFLVIPSECYEGFPMTVAEAYATGLPVVASKIGALESLIDSGRTGLHFRPGDPDDLAAKIDWLVSHPQELAQMRKEARAEFEAKYTAERNYVTLMDIYEKAIESARRGREPSGRGTVGRLTV